MSKFKNLSLSLITALAMCNSAALADQPFTHLDQDKIQILDIRRSPDTQDLVAIVQDPHGHVYRLVEGAVIGEADAEVTEITHDGIVLLTMVNDEFDGREKPQFFDIPFTQSKGKSPKGAHHSRSPFIKLGSIQVRLTEIRSKGNSHLAVLESAEGKEFIVQKGSAFGEKGVKVLDVTPHSVKFQEISQGERGLFITRSVTMKLLDDSKAS